MKTISLLAIGLGGTIALLSLLLGAVAFSDAYSRCPGNQCSDAIASGVTGALGGLFGLVLCGCGASWLLRRRV